MTNVPSEPFSREQRPSGQVQERFADVSKASFSARVAGGMGFAIRELLDAGLLHPDIRCVHGGDLRQQAMEPYLDDLTLRWRDPPVASLDPDVLRGAALPFDSEGGLRRLAGNLGRAIVKISAVAPEHRVITAPARVFEKPR